tara:strand:+ start:768 stop:1307 length:540 start_codon:yes stop_codon:yes gene_type:complete
MEFFKRYFDVIGKKLFLEDKRKFYQLVDELIKTKKAKKKVILYGNGGSAAMASHLSVDLTKACKIRAVNFNEADLLTCFSNDYGYENWVKEAINSYADKNDLVICISSSGTSKNIINGAIKAKKMGCRVITFSGFKKTNPLRKIGKINFWIDSKNYNIIEMTHHIWLLSAVDKIAKLKF